MSIKLFSILFIWIFIPDNLKPTGGDINIPKWPKQIETFIRVVVEESDEELQIQVHYDKENNSIAVITETDAESTEINIYSFDSDEWINIKQTECQVSPIPDRKSSIIVYSIDENKRKLIGDIASLVFFDPNVKAEIADLSTLENGIPVEKWETRNLNITQLDAQCNLTHSLTTTHWNNPGYKSCDDKQNQPCGQIILMEVDCYNEEEGRRLTFKAEFFNTKNYISNREVFQQPEGIYCENKKSKRGFPKLPKYFAFEFETYDLQVQEPNKDVWNFHQRIWFDKENKLIRRDELQQNFETTTTIIQDYDRRIVYSIDKKTRKCDLWNLTNDEIMEKSTVLPGESYPWFPESSTKEPQYVGQRRKHDLIYEVWTNQYKKDDSIIIADYYFLSETGVEDKEVNMFTPAFLEIRIIEDRQFIASAWQTINKYRTHPVEWMAFDVSECFQETNKRRLSLTLSGPIKDTGTDVIAENLRSNLLNLLKISPLRFGVPQVTYVNDESIRYTLIISERPYALGFGKNTKEPSLDEIYETLKNNVENGNVRCTLPNGNSLKAIEIIDVKDKDKNGRV
ncbi:uncharacterized protein LOC111638275 [Centruroides sculpturatus]|uniref:uncharacterized protein LOC111638275 n=1 Tax=Centruroides sculpturatus TaxID=218467 RepID=UPI000C6D5A74|nr:uncharacterized protein LOC111638275 [Centruroides sculpturatus]